MKKLSLGQSLFEVVIALAVVSMIIVALVILAGNSVKNTTFSRNKTLAGQYAQETIEWLRSTRDQNFDSFSFNALTPLWCFIDLSFSKVGTCGEGEELPGTIFRREVNFDTFTLNGKTVVEAVVRVYWQEGGSSHEVRLTTNFTDWRQRL